MKTLMKRSSHPSRGMLFIFCLVISLSLVIIALSQLRTRAQVQSGQIDQKQSSADQRDNKAITISDESPDAQVIEIPSGAGYPGLPSGTLRSQEILASQGFGGEVEPNGTFGTATPLGGTNVVVRANLFPNGDIDFYSFTAAAGDRVYAATMTSFSAGSSTDSQITLLASDGTTIIEFDDDNGTFAGFSSSIAGATISAPGTYYLKINDFTAGTTSERPYELHFRLQSGVPTPEVEGNDTPATANPLPPNGWVSGARNPAAATEQDWFSITLAAGDTVYLGLDLDPERDVTTWNGRLGFALFGDLGNLILVVDDAGTATGDVFRSEAMFFTVKTAGTYFAFVDSASAAVGGPTATYHLSVSVHPATNEGVNCTTYTSTDVPQTIGPGAGLVSSTITVPGSPRIQDLDVSITLNHALMADIDAHLRSPAGNDNGLFTDIGAAAVGGQAMMDTVFDDEAGIPPSFTALKGLQIKPELAYRLAWFDGENAGGTWTLDLRDDTTNASGGTLTSWSMTICEQPPDITCPAGSATIFSTDFEADDAGFTHSGTADEWERGLPATVATTTANPVAAFTTCNSGVNCWKTDLDNTYNVNSTQDLFSPNIDLTTQTAPIVLSWAQRYQIESATFDHAFVEVQEVGGAGATRQVWQWLDATMTNAPGNPVVNIGESAGWGNYIRDISDFAGKTIRVRFHLDSDIVLSLAGYAIDDVSVKACLGAGTPTPTPTPTVVTITPAASPTAADNDYTRINNAIQASFAGQTIKLLGTFNWTEPNAAASWALGSDGVVSTADDYSILVPSNLNNVMFTADNLGDGTIQGPGDLASVNLEGVLVFDGGDNQNWTISNIRFLDFDLTIGMFSGAGGTDAFNNTHITNNHILIARDLNATVAPADVNQNIGIHFSFGMNQVISGNTIDSHGDGVSNTAGNNLATDVGMQSNTSGGNVYDGLQIINNTIHVLNAQSADPQVILGIWENAHAHSSNITISNNSFTNQGAGNSPASNLQRGFRVTSHSSATTTVLYQNNTVTGANIGFQWLSGSNFAGNQPVHLKSNTITGNGTGVLVQSQGLANLSFNRIVGNTVTGLNNVNGTVTAENNWWGCNAGPGNLGCDAVTGVADFDPWLVLGISAVPSTIAQGGTSTITADMTHNSDGADTSASGTVPPTPVGFGATEGTMTPPTGTTSSGQAVSTFTSTSGNNATASATVDNQTVSANITVIPNPTPTPTPVIVADGSILVNESCAPANGQIDPGERATVHLKLKNTGGASTSNLVATLQSSGGVVAPSGPQNYGVISPGATVGRDFTFTADPTVGPGGTITATLQLQDGATNLGTVTYTFTAGPSPCGGVRLVTSSTLACMGPGNVQATITVTNTGTLPAANVMLTTATLGGTPGTPLPQSLGTINPGSSVSTTVNFATSSSGPSTLKTEGTFTGGTFSSTKRVTIPACSAAGPP